MSSPLSILLLEDDPSSIRLFTRKTQSAPVEMIVKDVRNKEAFLRELEAPRFDCIVIDYTLPDINGLEALRFVNELAPGTPTIIYTGSVGEEKAVECMKEGASEFLLKTNSIRLVPAILSVVNQKRDREARMRAEEAQRQSEARFKALAEMSTALIVIYQGERFTYVNTASEQITGYTKDELLNMKFWELVHPEYREMVHQRGLARQRNENVPARYEFKIVTKDGKERWMDFAASAIHYEGIPAGLGIAFDVTDRKRIEEQLQASELRYRLLFTANPHPMWLYDIDTLQFLEVNDAAVHYYGYSREEFLSMSIRDIRPEEDNKALTKHLKKTSEHDGFNEAGVWRHRKKNGKIVEVEIISHTLEFNGHNAKMILATEITKPKRTKKKKI
ncbi:MAG: PAS domain S-box protein [Ignavibacteriales bacterium]|nr:PAS domain S-box protein [Ignavibacteriales bacterium]